MKTNLVKAAVVIIAVLTTISVNAQNTKSFQDNGITQRISSIVKATFSNSSQELTEQLNNLKKMVQYTPAETIEYGNDLIETNAFDLSELESLIKFKPACFDENSYQTDEVFTETLKELEQYAKYRPTESNFDNGTLADIENELAATVKYTPASLL